MKCPVCCENFSGERCPHCGMRVSGRDEQLFCSEPARPAFRQPARPAQRQPVRRAGKASLAALERRQEASRKGQRALLVVVIVFVVILFLSFLPALLQADVLEPEPDAADAAYTELELDLEQWAQDSGKDAMFFYMEDPDGINGVLDQEGLLNLAEQAAAGDDEALEAWYEAEALCENFYEESRSQLDALDQPDLQLTAWLADEDSGDLVMGVDSYGVWYSYYEELLNTPSE